ncbi:hypothetical protein AMTR_s00163p00057660 [Amborella trichopoda]|uniref:Uncharacterized protein n=1 Tax=Amborella trichopoda TaxID=13333 RepID=W1PLX4_AMBTC|nr:hypothetical protein AMTR_s00163p00057660 [Amborella trichopoda]
MHEEILQGDNALEADVQLATVQGIDDFMDKGRTNVDDLNAKIEAHHAASVSIIGAHIEAEMNKASLVDAPSNRDVDEAPLYNSTEH